MRQTVLAYSMPERGRRGFTLIELLVVIAIIGILVSLIMPAVQQARAAARRTECLNNLKQLALAIHGFHDTEKAFPPARLIRNEQRQSTPIAIMSGLDEPTWLVRILPWMEQSNLYSKWDLYTPYHTQQSEVRSLAVQSFLCPERNAGTKALQESSTVRISLPCGCAGGVQTIPGGPVTDYVANHGDPSPGFSGTLDDFYWGGKGTGVLISSRPVEGVDGKIRTGWSDRVAMRDITDGTSNTIMVGEPHIPADQLQKAPWNGSAFYGRYLTNFARIGGPGIPLAHSPGDVRASAYSFGSAHQGVVLFALADGSARPISTSLSTVVLSRLTNRQDGMTIGEF